MIIFLCVWATMYYLTRKCERAQSAIWQQSLESSNHEIVTCVIFSLWKNVQLNEYTWRVQPKHTHIEWRASSLSRKVQGQVWCLHILQCGKWPIVKFSLLILHFTWIIQFNWTTWFERIFLFVFTFRPTLSFDVLFSSIVEHANC